MSGTDSRVQVNSGTGPYLATVAHTRGAYSDEFGLHHTAESYLPTYSVVTAAVSTATANSHLLQLMGSSAGRSVLRRVRVHQMAAAGANTAAEVQILRLTTAGTGGTAITPRRMDDAGDVAAGGAAMSLPTTKGTEGDILFRGVMMLTVAATVLDPLILELAWSDPRSKGPTVTNSTSAGLAVKLITAVASATVIITAEYSEVVYS
jgi:hypothetical protein